MRGYQLILDLEVISQGGLLPSQGGLLMVAELESLSVDEFKASLENVGLPVDFVLIYAATVKGSDKTEYVRGLRMKISSNMYPIHANQTLENIKFSLMQNLNINVRNKSFSFNINFAKSIGSHISAFGISDNYTYISSFGNEMNGFILNKLYFCEQVRLWSGEWHDIDTTGNIEVTLGGDNNMKVLHELEYSKHVAENGETYVQICVEDFNPKPKQNVRSAAAHISRNIILTFSLLCYVCIKHVTQYLIYNQSVIHCGRRPF